MNGVVPASNSNEEPQVDKKSLWQRTRTYIGEQRDTILLYGFYFFLGQAFMFLLSSVVFLFSLVLERPIAFLYSKQLGRFFANLNVSPVYDSISYTSVYQDGKRCQPGEDLLPFKDFGMASDFRFQFYNSIYDLKYLSARVYQNRTIERSVNTYIRKKCQSSTPYAQLANQFLTAVAQSQIKQLRYCRNKPFNLFHHYSYQKLTQKQQKLLYKNISVDMLANYSLVLLNSGYYVKFVTQELPFYCQMTRDQLLRLGLLVSLQIGFVTSFIYLYRLYRVSKQVAQQIHYQMTNLQSGNTLQEISFRTDIIRRQHLGDRNRFVQFFVWQLVLVELNGKYLIREGVNSNGDDILLIR